MAENLRVLMVEEKPERVRQFKALVKETIHSGRLSALRLHFDQVPCLEDALQRLAASGCDALLLAFSATSDLDQLAALHEGYPALPVIALTAAEDEPLALLAIAQGAADYLFFPGTDSCTLAEVFRHLSTFTRLARDQRRLNWLEDHISEVVWRARPDLSLLEVSASITRLAGFSVAEAVKCQLTDWIVPDGRQSFLDAVQTANALEGTALSSWNPRLELEHLRKNDAPFWAELSLYALVGEQGQLAEIGGVTRDISSRRAIQDKFEYASLHDPLTDLFNRAYFLEEIKRLECSRMYPITVLMADLEGLKTYNFQYGLAEVDELIKKTASLLRSVFRSEDMVARIGGDEFVAIMPRCTARAAGRALQRVVNLVEAYNEEQTELSLHLSLGIATADQGQSLVDIIKAASAQKFNHKTIL
jgi:diguanylate cyclase (GGDEF)-like protein